ncbi:Cyanidin 3-O-rutinoside 5-O-glucosyltransferase [Zea mays]|jgi:hypothetical protein|uniref:Glycosyltransferase n=2 Tax=Zea mays TaxID=4577 RepID=K7UNY3_MAIZE|nr:Cyanidin 3-O-rutinoside 5-O-glucosyltransferase [Zea mays]AQK48418.1 UDP-glycosyltransferase 75B1 [Zea mays]|eukprot:NP_001141445.2 uncharacterized protein LOC100273555 [Zea mays]
MADKQEHQQQPHGHGHHFLVVAYGMQSHVNPGRALAHRLARLSCIDGRPILATLSVPVAAQRRLFPSPTTMVDKEACSDGVISYVPHSDGFDDGASAPKTAEDWARRRRATAASLSAVVARFAAAGTPVTCIVVTMVGPAMVDVARDHGIPFAVYWIQPAAVLAAEYHYFHSYDDDHARAREVSLPGLRRPLPVRDFPSFLVDTTGSVLAKVITEMFRELFESMDRWRPKVLVNTLEELEAGVLAGMRRHLDLVAVGPMLGASADDARIHLFEHDDDVDKKRYMDWLRARPDSSVVYASFGSVTKVTRHQMGEVAAGLRQCGRPYLLVVRRDGLQDDDDESSSSLHVPLGSESCQQGMVVGWCDQLEVLSHPAVGCFVSHCGWNSTIEAMASGGVPIVGVPDSFDQPTNAYLVEEEWGVGIRTGRNSDGVLSGTELARCIELVMGDGARAVAIRERMKGLKTMAQAAADTGGSVETNLRHFVKTFQALEP